MVKVNILVLVLVSIITGVSLFYSQKQETNENTPLSKISLSSQETNETIEQLKTELANTKNANEILQQENITLKSDYQQLKQTSDKLQETKMELEKSNSELDTEITKLKERPERRRNGNNASPYTIDGENQERNNWRRGNPERAQQMRDWTALRVISDLPSLTEEQKAYHETLKEELKEFRIQMIRNEDKGSREEVRGLFIEKMEAYKIQMYSSLTPEQTTELNTMVDTEIQKRELERQR